MPPLITEIIPQQGFEKVRDQIGLILITELKNQKQLQGFEEDVFVYTERIVPMSEDEDLYFNILLDGATYGSFTEKDTHGRTMYYIDVYTTGRDSDSASGSVDSALRLHKFIGMVRFILSSTKYKTLALPLGLIGGTYVESFTTPDPNRSDDSNFTRFARLAFAVRIQENQDAWDGVEILTTETRVRLEESDKGYRYEFTTV